jgi:hypothetical protein
MLRFPGVARLLAHLALAGILALSLALNLSNAGFPLEFHADEPTKIEFIKAATSDFHHPLLMLQLAAAGVLNSLGPGMTWPALAVAMGGVAVTAWGWTRAEFRDRWMLAAALVFYLAVEIPPLKPWPDHSGYAIPVVPFLIYLGARGIAHLLTLVPSPAVGALTGAAAVAALIVCPLYDSTRLVRGLEDDTRSRAAAWLEANPGKALVEPYASVRPSDGVRSAGALDADDASRRGIEYVLASSFMYDRYRVGSRQSTRRPGGHGA